MIGWALGYGISYSRYGNTKLVDELREKFRVLKMQMEDKEQTFETCKAENVVLKQKAQELLNQNEDFSKMVSELTRYYYRIKQAAEKVKEMSEIVWIYDENMEQKLNRMIDDDSTFDGASYTGEQKNDPLEEEKKYF